MKPVLIKTDEWVSMIAELRRVAREADELGQRNVPSLLLSAFDNDDGNEVVCVELTKKEWQAVRRYLRRNRLRLLRKSRDA